MRLETLVKSTNLLLSGKINSGKIWNELAPVSCVNAHVCDKKAHSSCNLISCSMEISCNRILLPDIATLQQWNYCSKWKSGRMP